MLTRDKNVQFKTQCEDDAVIVMTTCDELMIIAEQCRSRRIWSNTNARHRLVWARDAGAVQGVQELSRHEDSRQAEGD